MYLKNLKLMNFRNYNSLDLDLNKNLNIIYGNNGEGKTNILEAIYILSFTKSHRSFIDKGLIKEGKTFSKIKGEINNKITYNLEVDISESKKQIKIDGNQINKLSDYLAHMNVVIFFTEDLEIIKGSPQIRRKYLNTELSQISSNYYNILNEYNKLIKMRNDYLKKISDGLILDKNYMDVLNDYIVEKGLFIYQMRKTYIDKLNKYTTAIYKDLSSIENFHIDYIPSINFNTKEKDQMKIIYKETLNKTLDKDLKTKTTKIGPHHDDIDFKINTKSLKLYGSQGQQRLSVLSLKLSEINILKDYKKTNPIILLDDVFSELDSQKKNNLLSYIDSNMQVIITTTDLTNIDQKIISKAKLIKVKDGQIEEVTK